MNCYYEKFENGTLKNIDEEIPFEIPESWEWVRLGNATIVNPRNKISDDMEVSFIPMTLIADGYKNKHESYNRIWKDIKSGFTHFAEGDIAIAKITPCFENLKSVILKNLTNGFGAGTTELHILRPLESTIDALFLLHFCKSPYLIANGVASYTGTAGQQRIGTEYITNILLPVPPKYEQVRIVERLQFLDPLLQLYETCELDSAKIGKELPQRLKLSILQYAIQGKLVPQNPNDEPTNKLLDRINEEKKRLPKEKRIKADKYESVIFKGADNKYYEKIGNRVACIEEEIPFQIPSSWEWVRLISICSYIQRGKSPKYSDIKKYPVIAQKCNQWDCLSLEKALFIEPESILKYDSERFMQENDILMNSTGTGTIGRTGYFTTSVKENYDCVVADSHITVIRCMKEIYAKYIYYYLCSPLVQNTVEEKADGSTNQIELNTSTVKSYLIPLPPFEEQKLIVSEIEPLLYKIKANLLF